MSDCRTCRYGEQCNAVSSQRLRGEGYQIAGKFDGGLAPICTLHKVIACAPCADHEREPGSEG